MGLLLFAVHHSALRWPRRLNYLESRNHWKMTVVSEHLIIYYQAVICVCTWDWNHTLRWQVYIGVIPETAIWGYPNYNMVKKLEAKDKIGLTQVKHWFPKREGLVGSWDPKPRFLGWNDQNSTLRSMNKKNQHWGCEKLAESGMW